MARTKIFAWLSLVFIMLSGMSSPQAQTITTIKEYRQSIDYTCEVDADCAIKDVGNCCGYYPECVNKDAGFDRQALNKICEGMGGVCGFPSVNICRCEQKTCKGHYEE